MPGDVHVVGRNLERPAGEPRTAGQACRSRDRAVSGNLASRKGAHSVPNRLDGSTVIDCTCRLRS